ncbi:MAG TPA: hypothetical protein VFQ28_04210, partial [Gaiella sp.]|nr:hypothetical protein [Gaiella sp.]
MRRLSAAAATVALAVTLAASAGAATGPYDPAAEAGAPSAAPPRLTEAAVIRKLLETAKVADWLDRYPPAPQTDATFDRVRRTWTVHVWSGEAGEIARGVVTDPGGAVVEAWTGPQVAWKMARGRPGAFGGTTLTSWPVWVGLSALFLLGLVDVRRPLSLRSLDLLVLVSFGVSLAFFNRGEVFRAVALAVPPLVYLLLRMAWAGFRRGPPARSGLRLPRWPVWALVVATLFLLGFRIGLNLQEERKVIDVGYAGVIGADRILDGRAPYGAMPVEDGLRACGRADADGEIRERIQSNGRCEAANPRGDTYGPVTYIAYVPAVLAFGWSGRWDALPAAHAAAIAFDLLALAGLVLVGRRLGGTPLAAVLAFGWVAYPFTSYVLLANSNDALMPALLVWGFWLASSPAARGAAVALAAWTKFAALVVAPLWLTYPRLEARRLVRFGLGFAVATLLAFSILLLEPSLGEALRTFWERTFGFQLDRESPFSIWGWGQYHAKGIPDLASLQTVVQVGVVVLAAAAALLPREKGPLELAALTAALLLAFELSLTHWFYLYLPWVLPFVLLALCLPRGRPA